MWLTLNSIYKGYGIPGSHSFRPVLVNLHWQMESGTRVSITGQSGSGKSTLLNLIGALDRPDSGQILFGNRDIATLNEKELAFFRNKTIGFVFQLHHLLPQLTLWENVLLPLLPFNKKISAEQKKWAEHLLKRTGIWDIRFQRPGEMSGGECQRTAVVRALINKPHLLLADEPTGALDSENAENLAEMLISLSREENVSMVVVTHSQELAVKMDCLFHLHDGALIQ